MYFPDTYDHYDTIAYPEHPSKAKTLIEKVTHGVGAAATTFLGLVGFGTKQQEKEKADFYLPNLEEMCKGCLDFYLQDYSAMLTDLSYPFGQRIVKVAEQINHIYTSLKLQYTLGNWRYASVDKRVQTRLPQVTLEYSRLWFF